MNRRTILQTVCALPALWAAKVLGFARAEACPPGAAAAPVLVVEEREAKRGYLCTGVARKLTHNLSAPEAAKEASHFRQVLLDWLGDRLQGAEIEPGRLRFSAKEFDWGMIIGMTVEYDIRGLPMIVVDRALRPVLGWEYENEWKRYST